MTLDQQFTILTEKLQQLLKQQRALKKENEQLKQQLQAQKEEVAETKNRSEELAQQLAIIKMATGDMSEKDKKDFERKINRYLKEIDKVINYLGQ